MDGLTEVTDRSEKIGVLKLLDSQTRGNYQAIRTWQGVYRLKERIIVVGRAAEAICASGKLPAGASPPRPPLLASHEGLCRFQIDQLTDSLWTTLESEQPMSYVEADSGRPLAYQSRPLHYRSVVTSEHFLTMTPNLTYGPPRGIGKSGSRGRVLFRKPAETGKRNQNASSSLDPRTFFGRGNRRHWDQLVLDLKNVEATGDRPDENRALQVGDVRIWSGDAESGPVYLVKTVRRFDEHGPVQLVIRYEAAAGFHPVLMNYEHGDGRLSNSRTWSYRQIDEIYVPETHVSRVFSATGDRIESERIVTLQEAVLNEPITPETFTIAQFQLNNGERVSDSIQDRQFVYDNGELEPAEAYYNRRNRIGDTARSALIWVNLLGMCCLVLFLFVRFKRKRAH